MKIAFHSNQLCERGTEVALFDYAHYAEHILGHKSYILHPADSPVSLPAVVKKFSERFETITYAGNADLERTLMFLGADIVYMIKGGEKDPSLVKKIPTMIHAVFPQPLKEVHGSSYAFVSEWLSRSCSNYKIPAVPHIVNLLAADGDLREQLHIPMDATVIGSYGGKDSIDIPFVTKIAIPEALKKRTDLFFLFLNITPFIDHPRCIFLPGTTSLREKKIFINTTDAMLHARLRGESFGLACAEFSISNRPVVTYLYSPERHHIHVLRSKGLYYWDKDSLVRILISLNRDYQRLGKWDCYSNRYSPKRVMAQFKRHLIDPAFKRDLKEELLISSSFIDPFAIQLQTKLERAWIRSLRYKMEKFKP